MWVNCQTRNLALTKESIAVIPGTSQGLFHSGGAFNAIAFKSKAAEKTDSPQTKRGRSAFDLPCPLKDCDSRHHLEEMQLFCSSALDEDSAYGLPLLFFERYTLVFPLQMLSQSKEGFHSAIFNVTCIPQIQIIENSLIRGVCMVRTNDNVKEERRCFVFPGRGTFGFGLTG